MQDIVFCRMISVQEVVLSTAVSSLGTLGRGAWTRRVGWKRGKIFSFFVQNRGKIFFFVQTRAKNFFFCSKPGQDFYFFFKTIRSWNFNTGGILHLFRQFNLFWRSVANLLGSCDQRTQGRWFPLVFISINYCCLFLALFWYNLLTWEVQSHD